MPNASNTTWATAVAQALTAQTTWAKKTSPVVDPQSGLLEMDSIFFIILAKAMEEAGAIRL